MQAVGTKGRVCAHLNVADHVTPKNGCQFVTVVLMVEPVLLLRRQGLQGGICGPQHSEGTMSCILKHGQKTSHLWGRSKGVTEMRLDPRSQKMQRNPAQITSHAYLQSWVDHHPLICRELVPSPQQMP